MLTGNAASRLTERSALRVPAITASFWLIKGLSTALGESTSGFLVHAMDPPVAVVLGFIGFVGALALQFRMGRYVAWSYWLTVVMVGIFGTMAADVLHVGLGMPYAGSTVLYAAALASVFIVWYRTEHTLSIHTIDSVRREAFYWCAVAATFAMGTALGDLTAYTFQLGFFPSALIFAGSILIPAVGFRFFRWNAVACFWSAYVITRPLGASLADGLAKPPHSSGLGLGDGPVALVLASLIGGMVAYVAVTKSDVQPAAAGNRPQR